MKNSIDYPQEATTSQPQSCSEKTCVTCFENRECIYEQYLVAPAKNTEEPQVPTWNNS